MSLAIITTKGHVLGVSFHAAEWRTSPAPESAGSHAGGAADSSAPRIRCLSSSSPSDSAASPIRLLVLNLPSPPPPHAGLPDPPRCRQPPGPPPPHAGLPDPSPRPQPPGPPPPHAVSLFAAVARKVAAATRSMVAAAERSMGGKAGPTRSRPPGTNRGRGPRGAVVAEAAGAPVPMAARPRGAAAAVAPAPTTARPRGVAAARPTAPTATHALTWSAVARTSSVRRCGARAPFLRSRRRLPIRPPRLPFPPLQSSVIRMEGDERGAPSAWRGSPCGWCGGDGRGAPTAWRMRVAWSFSSAAISTTKS